MHIYVHMLHTILVSRNQKCTWFKNYNKDLQLCIQPFYSDTQYIYNAYCDGVIKYNHHYVITVALPAPTNVKIEVVTSNSIEITWDELHGATNGYHISCITTALSGCNKDETVDGVHTTRHTLNDLVEDTPYDITVHGINVDSEKGDPSNVVPKRTGKKYIRIIIP